MITFKINSKAKLTVRHITGRKKKNNKHQMTYFDRAFEMKSIIFFSYTHSFFNPTLSRVQFLNTS
jgi:hypothetical protein